MADASDDCGAQRSEDSPGLKERLDKLTAQLEVLKAIRNERVTGCFEWMDGILVQALERGDWLVLDNVNLCNPTVLDRLNPLLEPGMHCWTSACPLPARAMPMRRTTRASLARLL